MFVLRINPGFCIPLILLWICATSLVWKFSSLRFPYCDWEWVYDYKYLTKDRFVVFPQKKCFSLKSEKRREEVEFSIKMLRLNFLPGDFCVKMQKPQLQPVFFSYTGVCDLIFFPLFACTNVMYKVLSLNGITMAYKNMMTITKW